MSDLGKLMEKFKKQNNEREEIEWIDLKKQAEWFRKCHEKEI